MNIKIKAIVVTFNGLKWIDRCIKSLEKSIVPIEIVVIDNGSTDGTIEKIQKDFPSVQLIANSDNLGFGRANNIGIKIAVQDKADYCFLLNQDAWIEPDSIKKLIELHKENTQYGILAPMRKVSDRLVESNVLKNIIDFGAIELLSDVYFKNRIQEIYSIGFIAAAAWLISIECINNVGGFDPIFFHYGEDNDYCARVKLSGFEIGICPNILVTHDTGDRIPDDKMTIRKKFASIIFHLRHTQLPFYMNVYYRLSYLYFSIFHKKKIPNSNTFIMNFKVENSNRSKNE